MKKHVRYGLMIASCLLLSGCNTIEHYEDTLEKRPLPALKTSNVNSKNIWANSSSTGVGKSNAKLRLSFTDNAVITADNAGQLMALDKKTGTLLWRVKTKANITAGPTVVQDRILVGTRDARVLTYRVKDGSFLWEAPVTGEVLAAPQGDRDLVFVHALDNSVIALNAEDGRYLWRYGSRTPSLMLRRSSSPALTSHHVLVGLASGKFVALNRMDGSPEWEKEIAMPKGRSDMQRMVDICADPIVQDNIVYVVSYQGRLAALSADSGAALWERDMSSFSGMALDKNNLYVSDANGVVWAVEQKTGAILWKQENLSGRRLSSPVVFNNQVFVGDDEGFLHTLAVENGAFIGRRMIDGKGIDCAPQVKDNLLYVLGRGGKIVALQH